MGTVVTAQTGSSSSEGGKSPTAFRTITEVSTELDLPQHVLRFWETKFSQIKPVKRRGGRRYYRPKDVALLKRIRELLYNDGYTIKGVQKLLREGAAKETRQSVLEGDSFDGRPETPAEIVSDLRLRAELETTVRELEALRKLLGPQ
jgi:DNA-binding transcriptional MerR regulator